MPVAPVDSSGTLLYYEDSGAPNEDSAYTTIVLLHGAAFHLGIYRRMLPFAAENHLRLFLVNSRDYPGSTPFSSVELEALGSPDLRVQATAVKNQGLELATFLSYIIDVHGIPPITESHDAILPGGLAVLSWSLGAIVPVSFLAHAATLPEKITGILESHLRSVILLDPALHTVGDPLPIPVITDPETIPPGLYQPFVDQTMTLERLAREFPIFASTYWTPVSDLSNVSRDSLALRVGLHSSASASGPPIRTPSVERMSKDEFDSVTDLDAFSRLPLSFGKIDLSIFKDNFVRALWEDGHEGQLSLPKCKVLVIWCDMSIIDCILAASAVWKYIADGRLKREVTIEKLESANHFVQWDYPERLSQFLAHNV